MKMLELGYSPLPHYLHRAPLWPKKELGDTFLYYKGNVHVEIQMVTVVLPTSTKI